jgi:hypothetical protein
MTATQVIKRLLGRGVTVPEAIIVKNDLPSFIGRKPYIKNACNGLAAISRWASKSHEVSLFGGVVGGTSILSPRMASPLSPNTSSTWCAAVPQLCPA